MMIEKLVTALEQFGPIPKKDYPRIAVAWQSRTVAEGQWLVPTHTTCQELFFVQQGILRVVLQPVWGRETTYSFARESQFSTILAGFNHLEPANTGIQAACSSQLLVISRSQLDTLFEQVPYLPGLFTQLTQSVLSQKIRTQQLYMGQPAMYRYELFLRHEADIAHRIPQHMIASYLDITPQSLSRLRAVRSA